MPPFASVSSCSWWHCQELVGSCSANDRSGFRGRRGVVYDLLDGFRSSDHPPQRWSSRHNLRTLPRPAILRSSVGGIRAGNCPETPKPRKNRAVSLFCQAWAATDTNGWYIAQLHSPQGLKTTLPEMVDLGSEIVKLVRSRLYVVAALA